LLEGAGGAGHLFVAGRGARVTGVLAPPGAGLVAGVMVSRAVASIWLGARVAEAA
jgi:hypothetical protein